VLRFSDGQAITVRRSVMVGRAPLPSSYDGRRECDTVTIDSPDHLVSRNHFELAVVDGEVHVVDAGSHNGTVVVHQDGRVDELTGGESVRLEPGSAIHFAERTARFDR
jgi:pSer/pThr/pTyr-binding forkhead associated (FHA) protein